MDEEQTFLAGLVAAANAVLVARAQKDPRMVAALEGRLAEIEDALREGGDPEATGYVVALRAALAGEDVAIQAARLPSPFRDILEELAEALSDLAPGEAAARQPPDRGPGGIGGAAAGPPAGGDPEAEGTFGEVAWTTDGLRPSG